jgi:hypothetical protein
MVKYGRSFNFVTTNAAAMTQLKSSGMLRMVKDDSLVALMGEYYERTYFGLDYSRQTAFDRRETALNTYNNFFTFVGLEALITRDTIYSPNGDPFRNVYAAVLLNRNPHLQLLTYDKDLLQKLHTDLAIMEMTFRSYTGRVQHAYAAATDLILAIKKEYHFD